MLISVIVPIYRAEEYLDTCLTSLLRQTYPHLEIILVDDGSPDGSGTLCDEYARRDSRVRVIHKENGGTHTARNRGIEEATGEYLTFIDPDDWLDTDAFALLAEVLEGERLDVIRFNYVREFAERAIKKENTFLREDVYRGEECRLLVRQAVGLVGEELAHPENLNFLASACFNLYRRSVIVENRLAFYNIRELGTFSDGLFNIEFYLHAKSFLFLDRGLYHYRKTNAASASSTYREDFPQKQRFLFEKIRALIEDEGINAMDEAYQNRIALSTMELCQNAIKKPAPFSERRREIRAILRDNAAALGALSLSHFPAKWKLYFFLAKHRSALGIYLLSQAIKKLRSRG